MRFSEYFQIERSEGEDWFDPHLKIDSKLFIDPLLMLEAGGVWKDAHAELISHFVHCYRLVGKAAGQKSVSAKAARRLLTFPEPSEIRLGYTSDGTKGSGSGEGYAQAMADGIAVAIAAGLSTPEHIEEIAILNVGIGADIISDATANVVKRHLISFTQQVAKRHKLPLDQHDVRNARVNLKNARWMTEKVYLPTNPFTKQPVLLVLEQILNKLPTLNADDWFQSTLNEDIRTSMNLNIGQGATKADIVGWARRYPERVREWARQQTSREDLRGYDFLADPQGVIQWDELPAEFANAHPLSGRTIASSTDLVKLIDEVVHQFKHFVEQQGGWNLLQNSDGTPKPEQAAQLLFLGLAQPHLRRFNVEVDREVNLGRGPVDFKVSSGTSARVIVEMKMLKNGRFWNGLEDQLTSYLKSDQAEHGWFIAIQHTSTRAMENRLIELPDRVRKLSKATGLKIRYSAIDARRPISASNIRAGVPLLAGNGVRHEIAKGEQE